MLPRNQRQEALSRAYVRAIAAQAGVLCVETIQDFGIDLFLRGVNNRDGQYLDTGPQLDIQLKSTTRAVVRDSEIAYDLEVRAYNHLRETPVSGVPRWLVVLVLPENEGEWVAQSVTELMMRRCAYWMSLRGAEPTSAHTTVRIAIPLANVFSADAIEAQMNALRQGEAT